MEENVDNADAVTFNEFLDGSTIVDGEASPTSSTTGSATSALTAALSSGTLGGYSVTSVSVT